ncbi:MAG TPA: protein kinase [Vicinamibacterales bacterium]|nr:protein kinase [Vicinamibacterales bacterium]
MTLAPGTRLGSYEILAAIGSGGMGEVYRARDTKLGREIAIKVVLQSLAADRDSISRLQREAQALAALNHPHIATLHGLEEDAGRHFLVMELVSGETLADRIGRGPVALPETLAVCRQIAEALEAAHERGIVHRDLKPANVKITPDEQVKVLDFGLAKALAPDSVSGTADAMNSPTLTARATQMGMVLGTAGYMAPEQAKGKPIDRRADVWAFGVVLYEMLTGRRAFDGEDVTEILASVIKDAPKFDSLPPDTPPSIRRLLRRCLEKDRTHRLDSMAGARLEIDDALRPAPDEVGTSQTAAKPQRPRAVMAVIGVVGVIAGAVLAGVPLWLTTRSAPPALSKFSITSPASEPLRLETNHPDLVITPDGSRVVYWNTVKGEGRFVVRPVDRFEGASLTNLGLGPRGPFLSPSGGWIGFYYGPPGGVGAGLAKVPIGGGAPIKIADVDSNLRGATWGPDEWIIFATIRQATGLSRVRASGGTPEVLTKPSSADNEVDHRWPSLLPDGRHVLFEIARPGGVGSSDIGLLSRDTGKWTVLIKGGTAPRYVKTGHIVYGSAGALRAIGFDLASLSVQGDPVQVVDGVVIKESGAVDFSVSDDGTLVYVLGGTTRLSANLAWIDRAGKVSPIAAEARNYRNASLPPNRRQAAVTIEEQGGFAIWLYDFARESLTRLTPPNMPVGSMLPVWSPDGRDIAFWSPGAPGGEGGGVFRMAASGIGAVERLTQSSVSQAPTDWTPDGTRLLLTAEVGGGTDVFLVKVGATPNATPLLTGPSFEQGASVSPDGKWLVYTTDASGRSDVFIRPFPNVNDDRIPISTADGFAPFWSRTGREVFYVDIADNLLAVDITPSAGRLAVGKPRRVFGPVELAVPRVFRITEDGQRFLIIQRPTAGDTAQEIRVVVNWLEELKTLVKKK